MDRRLFLRNCALLAAGTVAVDQLELLERLNHKKVWTGATFGKPMVTLRSYHPARDKPKNTRFHHLQDAIDDAFPGDLIIVDVGYKANEQIVLPHKLFNVAIISDHL